MPRRLRPGFWDNSGRCCGTAGIIRELLRFTRISTGRDPNHAVSLPDHLPV
ncbi:MAG TPA: hypothetical protein VGX23_11675 [Actinocrinis sp.]|nr:hypothetical protein [Actinocrinis sp.]